MIINYLFILITLLLVSGLAIDAGMLEWRQLHLQAAADAAAQEGMYQLARADANWAAEGQAQAAANGYTNGSNSVTVTMSNPPTAGTYTGNGFSVQATISQSVNNLFMGFVNGGKSTIAATAVAQEIPTCVWIMNPSGNSSGGSLWLASASLSANCGAYINTSSNYGLAVDGFSGLGTLRTRVVGNASTNGSSGYVSPKPIYSAATKNDPLAYIAAPSSSTCNYSAASLSGVTMVLSPSVFCGGTTISNSTITLTPGVYVFADGLNISGSTIYGTSGVNFYFTKHNSASYTNVGINNSTLYLKAPTSTLYNCIPGVVVFADRNWVAHGSDGIQLSNSHVTADGVWYALNTGMSLWATPFNRYKYAVWVLDNLYQFGASSQFGSDYSDLGGTSPLRYEDGVLVQ